MNSSSHDATPSADVDVDEDLVRRLLAMQQPDLSHLALKPVEHGWDNVMFRLGSDFAVRLPRRAIAERLLSREQRWLPMLAGKLPIPVPVPLRCGRPGEGYPFNWSVVPWLDGAAADAVPPDEEQAERLARFLECLHAAAPHDAPASQFRGVPLLQRAEMVETRLRRIEARTSALPSAIWRMWHQALEAPAGFDRVWIHGDLHARNVLVDNGAISGIIDWGDMTAGDMATDLASIWMLFTSAGSRRAAIAAYPHRSEATWARARGWAILFGALLLDTGLDGHRRHARMGTLTLSRVAEG